ncbi:SKI2 [Symbiodinium sp. CCMP2456]|nr:SKI2 [Symbiodinium sp. CCMP2456]
MALSGELCCHRSTPRWLAGLEDEAREIRGELKLTLCLDSEGHVFLLCGDEVPDQKQITRMMTSKAEPLASRFRVTFAMILQMKRFAETGVRVEDLLGQSFLENARACRRPEARRHLKDRMLQLEALPAVQCILGEPDIQETTQPSKTRRGSWGLSEGLGEVSV